VIAASRVHHSRPVDRSQKRNPCHACAILPAYIASRPGTRVARLNRRTRANRAAAAPAPAPDNTLTSNIGLFSQYIFRGIAQTAGQPAVQAASTMRIRAVSTSARGVEHQLARGLRRVQPVEPRMGLLRRYKSTFPGARTGTTTSPHLLLLPASVTQGRTTPTRSKMYGGIGWKWLSAKASYNFQNYFGAEPTGRRRTGPGTSTSRPPIRSASRVSPSSPHYGILGRPHDGSGSSKVGYEDWKLGASYTVPTAS